MLADSQSRMWLPPLYRQACTVVLAYIGAKLVLEFAHHEHHAIPEISTVASLVVIVTALTLTMIASLVKSRRDPTIRAHSGSLRHRGTHRGARVAGHPAPHRAVAEGHIETSTEALTPDRAPAEGSPRQERAT